MQDLYRFLSTYTPPHEPGGEPEYSNLGVSLLGRLLALRVDNEYKELLKERVLQPLDMDSTAIQLSSEQLKRLALGHDKDLQPAYTAEMKTLYPSGSLRSSANDLLKYLAANLGAETLRDFSTRVGPLQISFQTDENGNVIGLTWYPRGKAGGQSEYATRVH